jgi:hypothetical protein
MPEAFQKILERIDFMDFDIFELRETTEGQELVTVALFLMNLGDFFRLLEISVDKFTAFVKEV